MKKYLLIFIFLAVVILGYSQNNKLSYPNFIGQDIHAIEKNSNWKVLQKSFGDLNKDGVKDAAIILESKDSILEKRCANCKIVNSKPRIILILLNQKGHEKVIIQNNVFIAREDEGGMLPYLEPELSIENEFLTIYYQYTRANQSYTFEFNNGSLKIKSAEDMGVHSATGNFENNKYDFKKGILTVQKGNIAEEKVATETFKITVNPKVLSAFGKMYSWQIIKNKYL